MIATAERGWHCPWDLTTGVVGCNPSGTASAYDHGPTTRMIVTACPECATPLDADANFCPSCGADVREATRAMTSPRGADEAETTVMPAATVDDPTSAMVRASDDEDPTDPGEPPPVTSSPTEVIATAGSVPCPNCGAPNSSRRSLCGRCGADMKTGTVAPRPAPRPVAPAAPTEPRASERDRATRGRTIAIIVAGGILIGGLIGAAVALGLGPLGADDEELPAVTFDATIYDDEATALPLIRAATRTVKPAQAGVSYGSERMFDGDLATAWLNSGDTLADGVDEVIRVELSTPAWVTEIILGNGNQSDTVAFGNYGRIHRVTARADGEVVVGLVFLDTEGQQAVRFPDPVLTTAIRLEINQTFAGATFPDLAVSELAFRGHVASGGDIELAEQRAQLAPTPGQFADSSG